MNIGLIDTGYAQPARPDPGGILQMAGCPRQAGEYRASFDDRIVLDKLFFDSTRSDDDNVHEAILQQLKYLWGYYRNEPELHAKVQLVLSAEAPQIAVKSQANVPYGRELQLPWSNAGAHMQIDQPYQLKAIQRGYTHKDDPALAIEYRITFKVALCGEPRADNSTIPTMLPEDPWLMHWHVPQSAHRRLCYYSDCAVTSPCNDNDYADLPHPFYHWYDWYPDRHGPDADGKVFDCRALLKPEVDYFARTVNLIRLPSAGGDFLRMKTAMQSETTLKATVLIGVLDHAWKDLTFDEIASQFGATSHEGEATSQRADALLDQPASRERGTVRFLRLLADLPEIIDIARATVGVEDGYLRAELEGTLKRSHKPIRLRTYVGLTDIFGPTPPAHWPILRRALASDDVIVYAGHSGIGENFRLAQIERNLKEPHGKFTEAFARAPYQLIAFLSCYSYMYYGQDLTAAAGETTTGREFVYTGTEFTKGDRGALAILDLVDQVLSGTNPALRFVEPADFLMVKRVDGLGATQGMNTPTGHR